MSKTTRRQCGHPAGWGTPHNGWGLCRIHGGTSPLGEKQAQRLQAAASAQALGVPVETTPEEALEAELWRTAGTVAWLGEHLQSVAPEKRVGGEMGAFARLYSEERTRLTAVAKACVDLGLDERRVSALERAAESFAEVLRRILSDLGVLDDPRAPEIVRLRLAQLGPGTDA
jgi:hypothetical protein